MAIRVDEPCSEEWEDMRPGGASRSCAKCRVDVLDATQMTEDEFRETVAKHGSICARFDASPSGELVFLKKRGPTNRAASMFLAAALSSACGESAPNEEVELATHQGAPTSAATKRAPTALEVETARQRAEEERQRRAEEEQQRRAEEEQRRRAEAPPVPREAEPVPETPDEAPEEDDDDAERQPRVRRGSRHIVGLFD